MWGYVQSVGISKTDVSQTLKGMSARSVGQRRSTGRCMCYANHKEGGSYEMARLVLAGSYRVFSGGMVFRHTSNDMGIEGLCKLRC